MAVRAAAESSRCSTIRPGQWFRSGSGYWLLARGYQLSANGYRLRGLESAAQAATRLLSLKRLDIPSLLTPHSSLLVPTFPSSRTVFA